MEQEGTDEFQGVSPLRRSEVGNLAPVNLIFAGETRDLSRRTPGRGRYGERRAAFSTLEEYSGRAAGFCSSTRPAPLFFRYEIEA